jgi:hypothetical protein
MAKIGTLIPLPFESAAVLGVTHILRLTYADIASLTSGTAQAVIPINTLAAATGTLPAGMHVSKVIPRVVTAVAASAGTLTTLTFILGDDGSTNRYVASMDAMTAAWGTAYTSKFCYTAANTIDIIFTLNTNSTAVISTVATLSAGQIDFYVKLEDTSGLSSVVEPS